MRLKWSSFRIFLVVGLATLLGTPVLAQAPDVVVAVALSPSGDRLAVAGTDGLLKIVNPTTGADIRLFSGLTGSVVSVAWSPDGSRLASTHIVDDSLRIWNTSTGELLSSVPLTGVQAVAWSPNGTYVGVVSESDSEKSEIQIHTTDTLAVVCTLSYHSGIFDLSWSPANGWLAIPTFRGVELINPAGGCAETSLISNPGIWQPLSISFNPTGSRIAVGDADGKTAVIDTTTLQIVSSIQHASSPTTAVEWSANGSYLASAAWEGKVTVSNPTNGQLVAVHAAGQMANVIAIWSVAFSADGTRLYYGDGTVVHNVPTIATATPTPSPTPTHTPTPTPQPTVTLNLTVSLSSHPAQGQIFRVLLSQAGIVRQDVLVDAESGGLLSISGILPGQYDIWGKHPQALAVAQPLVTLSAPTTDVNMGMPTTTTVTASATVRLSDRGRCVCRGMAVRSY